MSTKTLIINPIGGLANRMRAIASGVALASDLKLPCKIIWPVNSDLRSRFDRLFEDSDLLPEIKHISPLEDLLKYDDPRRKNFYLSRVTRAGRFALILSDNTGLYQTADDYADVRRKVEEANGDVLIRSGIEYYPFQDSLYRDLFTVRPELLAAAEERIKGDRMIGLHIRRTDNAMAILYSPLRLFIDVMDREISEDPAVKFYLASDSEDVKKELTDRYGERVVYSRRPTDRDSEEGIREAVVELTALSLCDKIYGSFWSSFSEAAARIGGKEFAQLKLADPGQ